MYCLLLISAGGKIRSKMKPFQRVCCFKSLLANCCCHGQLHSCLLPPTAKKIGCAAGLHNGGFWKPKSLLDTARFTLSFNSRHRKNHQDSRALWKQEAVQKYLETLSKEYQQVSRLLNADSVNDFEQRTLRRRCADLSPIAAAFQEIREAEKEVQELEAMCKGKENTSAYFFQNSHISCNELHCPAFEENFEIT